MCIRIGADSGRDFLSTEDPISQDKKKLKMEVEPEKNDDSAVQRFHGLQKLLRQLYSGGVNNQ